MSGRIASLLLGAGTQRGWVGVGHPDPPAQVDVSLVGAGATLDVSRNHVMVALVPFTLALCLPKREGESPPLGAFGPSPSLLLRETAPHESYLGRVRLRPAGVLELPDTDLALFTVAGSTTRCLAPWRLALHALLLVRRSFARQKPGNIKMTPRDLLAKFLLYCQPRPVMTVSYRYGTGGNVFPVDLLGEAQGDRILLGLRAGKPALEVLTPGSRLAVSALPLALKAKAFALASNHRHASVELDRLPLASAASPELSIPVPEAALAVHELAIEQRRELGSHVLLVTRRLRLSRHAEGLVFGHTHAFYQHFLTRRGRPLPERDGD